LLELTALSPSAVLQKLESCEQGLSAEQVESRRARWGDNTVAHEKVQPWWIQVAKRLLDPLNLLLLTLATISVLTGDREAPIIIVMMVLLSLSLSIFQERRSGNAARRLQSMVHTTVAVVRQAGVPLRAGPAATVAVEMPLHELVPGDIVHLSAGDMIPADLRLLAAKDLFVNQSSLTGEALPSEKQAAPMHTAATDIGGLSNLCFMGTTVVSGSAVGVIALTGRQAYFGGVAALIAGKRAATSFDKGVRRFGWLMIRFILVMAPLVFLINGLTKGDWLQALLFATAVAVGLTPEMLPMIVTVNLAKGALAMSQERVILQKHVDLQGEESESVLEYAYLNSCYQSGLRNLLDIAVLQHDSADVLASMARQYRKIDEVPFDFERRRMSVAVEGAGRRLLICKGAVEEVLSACQLGSVGSGSWPLDESHLQPFRERAAQLNEDGFRVIAVAIKELAVGQSSCGVQDEAGMVLVGFIAFLDPPKESAGPAIQALAAHGVQVKVLTGDNEVITRKVCREVNLPADRVVLGGDLAAMTEVQLSIAVEQAQIFAKLSPTQKAAVIQALQKNRHVVGFLGDGINDGPALRAADVGISVDSAMDIAKESADIILLDKSLMILDRGVIEGRRVFANVLKYIRMGASSNFGNMLSVLGASAWLPFLPMAPIQILANNLLYDFSQTATPTDNVDAEYLARPRRWEIGNIGRYMLFVGPISSIFDYAIYLTMYFGFGARTGAQASLFQSGWFVESLLSQTLIIHIIRTGRLAFIESRASLPLTVMSIGVCLIGIILPYSPLAPGLQLTPLPMSYWPILLAMILTYLALTHLMKKWLHQRFGVE
jgi:P-type Mg2+ transporter